MNEDFVSFDLAKKLKEKGFRYNKNNLLDRLCMENQINHPSISQVLKWLREEKKIHIIIDVCNGNWEYSIKEKIRLDESLQYISQTTPVPICRSSSYEEAALAGIEYVLDNLI